MRLVAAFLILSIEAIFGFHLPPPILGCAWKLHGGCAGNEVLQTRSRDVLSMKVVGVSRSRVLEIIPRKVTPEQVAAYWGVNPKERLQRILESALVSYGGAWAAWFLSFMAGGYVAAFVGTFLIFNWMYTPWVNAKKRNAKIWPSTGETIHYAVFMGRIKQLKKVKRRAGKSIGAVAQEYLLMLVKDERGRELEVVTQWQPSYSKLRKDMRCDTIISSLNRDFESIFMIADLWAPACNTWIGDYPYLQRQPFKRVLADINARLARNDIPPGSMEPNATGVVGDGDVGKDDIEASSSDGILNQWVLRAKATLDGGGGLSPDFEAGEEGEDTDFYPSDSRASSRFVRNVAASPLPPPPRRRARRDMNSTAGGRDRDRSRSRKRRESGIDDLY